MLEHFLQLTRDNAWLFVGLTIFSIVTVVLFMTVGARVLATLSPDFFLDDERRRVRVRFWDKYPPAIRWLILGGKNVLGVLFIALGIIQLVVPGQGLLTILAGVLLLDFPRKRQIELAIVRRPSVSRALTWLRRRRGAPPFLVEVPDERERGSARTRGAGRDEAR